jgi:formylglycine-generating enzyme required for sulfatase activity
MLAGLRHHNLPRVTDYFIVPGQGQYLVMDFVEGYDLQTILDSVGQPLAEKQVLLWIDQICDALVYLHSQNPPIIHRDIKPANIKITSSGEAMLVDFGIAKHDDPKSKTDVGAKAVTAGFSPVEQYGNEGTDARTDVYALGATLYTLLTGQKPPESVARVTGVPLISPSEFNPHISVHVEHVILRAMETQTTSRFLNMAELKQALKKPVAQTLRPSSRPATPVNDQTLVAYIRDSSVQPLKPLQTVEGKNGSIQVDVPSPCLLVKMEWITVSEGEFLFGEDRKKIFLPTYQIARFPVTNQQYELFLEANPHQSTPRYWKGRSFSVGKYLHPVVGISLYDALAFCEWLGCRLPAEEEWEKAARGKDGRSFPWGEDWQDGKYCNNYDAKLGGTSSVEKYRLGASPFGVLDMAGNIWEWTTSQYQGPHMHVLKGGSWKVFGGFNMRIPQRDWLTLGDTRDDVGFRCARTI